MDNYIYKCLLKRTIEITLALSTTKVPRLLMPKRSDVHSSSSSVQLPRDPYSTLYLQRFRLYEVQDYLKTLNLTNELVLNLYPVL